MAEITRKPTARQIEALRTALTNADGIIEVSADKRTHEGLVGRDLADWARPEALGRSVHGSALCVITEAGRAYLAKLDGEAQQEDEAEVIETPAAELLEECHYSSPQQAGTHSQAYLTKTMIRVGVREDGTARRVHGMECRACGATNVPLAEQPCTVEREAEVRALRAITEAPTREGKRAAVRAVKAEEAAMAPVVDEFASMGDAVAFLAGLEVGDRVRITKEGRTGDYTVTRGARREGSQGTVNVTVSVRPGGYSFEVSAGNLFAQRGDKATMTLGGTKMMRTPQAPVSAPTATEAEEGEAGFYVTARCGGRAAALLGPYATHAEALGNVDRAGSYAREHANDAAFAAFGTARLVAKPGRALRLGKLNDRIGLVAEEEEIVSNESTPVERVKARKTAAGVLADLGAPKVSNDAGDAAEARETRLAAMHARRDEVLAVMDAGRSAEYLAAHKVMSRVYGGSVKGMRATRAYWVNANNGAEEVAYKSTQEQARTYAYAFKLLADVVHGPHACTLVFEDGTREELISYDVVCILPAPQE